MASDLSERLATLDAENRLRDEPAPLAARWWELNGLRRESLTRWTPIAVGARVVRRGDDGRLVVEVSDVGAGFDRAKVWETHPPEPYGRRRRGLWIARQLADIVSIDCGAGRTRVRIELSPDPQIGA